MSAATDLLQHYLAQLSARGVTHVQISDSARASLGGGRSSPPASVPSATKSPSPAVTPATAAPASGDKRTLLAEIAAQAGKAAAPRELGTLRDIMVFATGNPEAELMFIGEAPGAEEERQREPFVGPAGQLLTKIIQAMGLARSSVYISNICKFRPVVNDGRPQNNRNRAPSKIEMDSCLPFINAEIDIIQPRVIVALGSTALTGLGIEGSVSRLRGQFHEFRGIPVMATYHPSYLLRCEQDDGGGRREKRLVWEDMLQVMERLGLPISEKQRAYFTKSA